MLGFAHLVSCIVNKAHGNILPKSNVECQHVICLFYLSHFLFYIFTNTILVWSWSFRTLYNLNLNFHLVKAQVGLVLSSLNFMLQHNIRVCGSYLPLCMFFVFAYIVLQCKIQWNFHITVFRGSTLVYYAEKFTRVRFVQLKFHYNTLPTTIVTWPWIYTNLRWPF